MSRFKSKYDRTSNKLVAANHIINDQISAKKLQVIGPDGKNYGIVPFDEALYLANNANLDLVQVGTKGDTVIAKIMDFGKFLYAKKKQAADAKKKQKIVQIKEIKLRPNIDQHDYDTKFKRAVKFLKEGKKVKFTLQFRGREFIMMKEIGANFFNRIQEDLLNQNFEKTLIKDKESKSGHYWSIIYFLK